MGTSGTNEGFTDEHPQRKVFLRSFWIDITEITNRQYQTFVDTTGHPPPHHENSRLNLWTEHGPFPGTEYHPVVNITWNDAQDFCHWQEKRLPTEAEWEKAARGIHGQPYPWGDRWNPSLANSASYWAGRTVEFKDFTQWQSFWVQGMGAEIVREQGIKGEVLTKPVGSFPEGASPYGLLDMAGNVSEWVSDWNDPYYYMKAPFADPQGPTNGILKTIRGGSWLKPANSLRTAHRDYGPRTARYTGVGFRCARDDR